MTNGGKNADVRSRKGKRLSDSPPAVALKFRSQTQSDDKVLAAAVSSASDVVRR